MIDYTNYTDSELRQLAVAGDTAAEEELIERYAKLVRICARPYFLAGGDSEDLTQEGMLGLLSAIRNYVESGGATFRTFAEICIRNRVLEAVKAASRKKHEPLNDGVSLEYIILSEESRLGPASQQAIFRRAPEEQVLARESEKEFYSTFSRCLSVFETKVLFHYLEGEPYRRIAEAVGSSEKSVDNAVQRIRRKLARQPFPGDISRS